MRLGLVINGGRDPARRYADRIAEAAGRRDIAVVATTQGEPVDLPEWGDEPIDFVVAVGGDGTVLDAARRAVAIDRPLVGINLGTIGFLAEAEPDDLDSVLDALSSGRFRVEERNTIRATLPAGEGALGINDTVVEKIDSQRLVVLTVTIDDERFLTYRADGIVVATSTGSTAYSFSAGGPLLDPLVGAVLITPVAPHSLFDRTMVVPAHSTVHITVAEDRPVRVSVDGVEVGEMGEGDTVDIQPGERTAKFIRLGTEGFARRVTRKFGLGD